MAAFLLADVPPEDAEGYRSSGYLEAAKRTAEAHGGTYIARGGASQILEGDWEPDRMVIIQFPSMDALLTWYHSDEYQEWVEVRRQYVPNSRVVALQGVE